MSLPDPVMLVIRRQVDAPHRAQFEAELTAITRTLATWPGHLGTGVVRPHPGGDEYTLMVRFGDARHAAGWETSPERAEWLTRIAPLIRAETPLEQQPGLEFWFTPPGSSTLAQPPRWKMTLITLLALYPVTLGVALLLLPAVTHWPLPLRSLVQSACVVPLMTYLVMPPVTRWFGRWLVPPT